MAWIADRDGGGNVTLESSGLGLFDVTWASRSKTRMAARARRSDRRRPRRVLLDVAREPPREGRPPATNVEHARRGRLPAGRRHHGVLACGSRRRPGWTRTGSASGPKTRRSNCPVSRRSPVSMTLTVRPHARLTRRHGPDTHRRSHRRTSGGFWMTHRSPGRIAIIVLPTRRRRGDGGARLARARGRECSGNRSPARSSGWQPGPGTCCSPPMPAPASSDFRAARVNWWSTCPASLTSLRRSPVRRGPSRGGALRCHVVKG